MWRVDCGNTDVRVLDADHILPGKTTTISKLLDRGRKWPVIEAELRLCQVRCRNCHNGVLPCSVATGEVYKKCSTADIDGFVILIGV